MRYLATVLLSLTALLASAEEPKAVAPVTKAKVYETDKYGNQRNHAFLVKDNKVYRTDQYGNAREQAYVIKGDRVYATDRYGSQKSQAFVVKDRAPATPKK